MFVKYYEVYRINEKGSHRLWLTTVVVTIEYLSRYTL